jgi:predicted site-specific integrase-resolvase
MKSSLSANEFARLIKRDPKTIIEWIKRGYIPGVKRTGHVYQIPAKEIEVYQSVSNYPPKKWHT